MTQVKIHKPAGDPVTIDADAIYQSGDVIKLMRAGRLVAVVPISFMVELVSDEPAPTPETEPECVYVNGVPD